MSRTLTVDIPDDTYAMLEELARERGCSPEAAGGQWLAATMKRAADDPLLSLAGTLESEIADVADRHDHYIGVSLEP